MEKDYFNTDSVRAFLMSKYNDKSGRWNFTAESANNTIDNIKDVIADYEQKIKDCCESLFMLKFMEMFDFKIWGMDEFGGKGIFIGTNSDFAEKAKELGISERDVAEYIGRE